MDWIRENFQIFILIALGVGSVIKSLLESKAKQKQEAEEEYDPGEVFAPDEDDREPAMPSVPSPLNRNVVPPPVRESGYYQELAEETAKALKHQHDLAERLRHLRETKANTTGGAHAAQARISTKKPSVALAGTSLGIRDRLRSQAEVRSAVVLREILDPPLSLR
ncbi:MAG: hypothetical protein ACRDBP_18760 [Luteolibacter sp.]